MLVIKTCMAHTAIPNHIFSNCDVSVQHEHPPTMLPQTCDVSLVIGLSDT